MVFLCTPGCTKYTPTMPLAQSPAVPQKNLDPSIPKTKHKLIVLIHGTLLPIPSLECMGSALHTLLAKGRTLKKSLYQLYLDELKRNAIFKYQPNGPDGLCLINKKHSLSAQISAAILTDFYQENTPDIQLSCYTFGWSGRLAHGKRISAAKSLYQQLIAEVKKIDVTNSKNVAITLIGHSHGGNVILNLARAEEIYKQNLVIDKTILLGTPIQSETQSLISSPIFKSIYHCYSNGDNIQKMDFISTKDDYSQRRFNLEPDNISANKLTQIELRLGRYKPGHGELWLRWGKNNGYYRKKLPTFPLPTFAFLPEIILQLEKIHPKRHDVTVNIDQKETNYTIEICDNDAHSKMIGKELTMTTLSKKIFAPHVQTILQAEKKSSPKPKIKTI